MRSTRVLAWVAAGLLGVGLLIGFALPVHAEGVSCGTALRKSDKADVADLFDTMGGNRPRTGVVGGVEAACDSARDTPRVVTFVLIGFGVVAGMAALLSASGEVDRQERGSRRPSRGAAS